MPDRASAGRPLPAKVRRYLFGWWSIRTRTRSDSASGQVQKWGRFTRGVLRVHLSGFSCPSNGSLSSANGGTRVARWSNIRSGYCQLSQMMRGTSMARHASSRLVSTGLLVLTVAVNARHTQAASAATLSTAVDLTEAVAVEDRVVLERRFDSTRSQCTADLGVPTSRVLPDGTRESFVVPAGKAFVLTDLEGEITE